MTDTAPTSEFFTTDSGTKTHYTRSGNPSGQLLITLHGLGGSSKTFEPLLPKLPLDRFRVIGVDFEGFGKTPVTSKPASVARYVSDLDDLITHLQRSSPETSASKPVVIIGHSLGTVVALHYTAKKPDRVAGLGLLGVGRSASHIEAARERMLGMAKRARSEGIEPLAELAMTTNFPEHEPQDIRLEVGKAVASSNPEGYAKTCEAMASSEHVDQDYGRIMCPSVFITGEKDMISPPTKAKEVSGLVGGSSKVEIVKGGHQPILSDLDGTAAALEWLFERI
ncbi:Pimeloyl-[acyl-carrier protein] methyl ester esterase [Pseudocercospora fuligena]|uniref:Pimeloyl-[acyl-carrier protein] methyl ester esterase n=1 Tax=Pseudocercospora fuligena TaxID=685502 RepID=A0A8H6R8Z8_9PEZI|nr:Pimeloyl-[acyl-carrier protein] methyl ester esterase [Pseudocercospora fuligena]